VLADTVSSSTTAGWLSYDSVADTYERVAVPWFTALANDLITTVDLRRGERVLDVGTGTALAARAALNAQPTVAVVGVDPSVGMLTKHPTKSFVPVAAMAPGLPFPSASFDAAIANLSVSHLPDHSAGVTDIARVLRPGGRFACTAWAAAEPDGPGNERAEADQIVDTVRNELGLNATPPAEAAPWEEWLKDPDRLHALFADAGFGPVHVTKHRSPWTLTIDEFMSGWGSRGRYLRATAGERRWRQYVEQASASLRDRFDDHIDITNVAWIALGHTPAT
jgi:SAM-dependent methyltransferase